MVEATGLGVLHAAPANSHTGLFGLLFRLSAFIYFVSKQVGSRKKAFQKVLKNFLEKGKAA